MKVNNINIKNTTKRRKKHYKINKGKLTGLLLAIIVFVSFGSIVASASVNKSYEDQTKYYTSVNIKNGDNLTSIAKEYMPYDYELDSYIKEIMTLNNLNDSNNITSGQNLIVFYYK